jgi:hypothetical protein
MLFTSQPTPESQSLIPTRNTGWIVFDDTGHESQFTRCFQDPLGWNEWDAPKLTSSTFCRSFVAFCSAGRVNFCNRVGRHVESNEEKKCWVWMLGTGARNNIWRSNVHIVCRFISCPFKVPANPATTELTLCPTELRDTLLRNLQLPPQSPSPLSSTNTLNRTFPSIPLSIQD